MNNFLKGLAVAAMLCSASISSAGPFQTNTFGKRSTEGASIIQSVVTDRFTDHFPENKWTIVIVSSGYASSEGGGFAHATVGVSPAGPRPIVPKRSYSSYRSSGSSQFLGPREVAELERHAIRRATEDMMMDCEETPKCNVYSPY